MMRDALAAFGLICLPFAAAWVWREVRWRWMRDPAGNSGRFGKHWTEE
jgi:hypothetical protein